MMIAAAMLAPSAAFASFNDVNEYSAEYQMLSELEALGIVDGNENGDFAPYDSVTRAEFAKLLVMALGEEQVAAGITATRFKDCRDHWAAGYVETGVANGSINGYDDSHFGADDNVTYAQAVKMLVAATGYTTYAEGVGGWPAGYLRYGGSTGITKGITGVDNDTEIDRLTAARLLYNALDTPLAVTEYNGTRPQSVIKDGKSGREYKTLLTERHDAYRVKGRITGTSRSSGLKKGYVDYKVEVSDNFDGEAYGRNDTETFPMYVGSTDMTSFLFVYTEALVKKVDDGEYTIISIKAK